MRSQESAAEDAQFMIVDTIEALQDADAPDELISEAESLQREISEWSEENFSFVTEA